MSDLTADNPLPPPVQPTLAPLLPPLTPEQSAQSEQLSTRLWSSFTFLGASSILGIGLYLNPSPTGTGTHQQLGFPPCGWLHYSGYPCPMCGCTTSVSHFVHGNLVSSFLTQPFGFVFALLATVLVPLTLVGMIRGKWIGPSLFTLGWYWRSLLLGSFGLILAAWIYKIIITRAGLTF